MGELSGAALALQAAAQSIRALPDADLIRLAMLAAAAESVPAVPPTAPPPKVKARTTKPRPRPVKPPPRRAGVGLDQARAILECVKASGVEGIQAAVVAKRIGMKAPAVRRALVAMGQLVEPTGGSGPAKRWRAKASSS